MEQVKYIPSKFNALTKTEDGGVIVYNSYTGAIVNFDEKEREEVLTALKRQGSPALDTEVKQALFDNGFIVKDTVDELKRADLLHQTMHRTDMLHLILMTTEQCNFRCRYCYESFAKGKMTDETKAGVKALVKERAGTLDNLHISWFGGEPLLELGIIEELSKEFMAQAEQHNIDYSADVVTNGYFLNRETFEKLLSWNVSQYMVTIDGVQAVHDARRHMIGGQGTFEKIVENLQSLRDVEGDFNMTIRINFDEDNLRETEHLIDFLKEHFANDSRFGVFFRPVGRWGGPNDEEIPTCTHITANKKIWEFTETAMDKGLAMSNMVEGALNPTAAVCYAAKPNAMVIGSDGQLYKCTTVLDEEVNKVGKIQADGTMDLDYDKIASWLLSGEETDTVCQSCFFRPACQGNHCPWYRVVSGERPCPSEKKNKKKVLNLVWKNSLQTVEQ